MIRNKTFTGRLRVFFNFYSLITIFSVIGVATFITLSLEDAVFNKLLFQFEESYQRNEPLPNIVNVYADDDFPFRQFPQVSDGILGEFSSDNRRYHYRKIVAEQEITWLLMDVTDLSMINIAKYRVVAIYLPVIIVLLILANYLAVRVSVIAIRPFRKLVDVFENKSIVNPDNRHRLIHNIPETDVRQLAERFHTLLREKDFFYKGISHELRTPLQVMKNASTLLEMSYPELKADKTFQSSVKAAKRMERISQAFLWLTHSRHSNTSTEVLHVLKYVSCEMEAELAAGKIDLNLNIVRDCTTVMPRIVLELVIYNLIENAIHHASGQELTISLNDKCLRFRNTIENRDSETLGFNFGLSLVKNLSDRFNVEFSIEKSPQDFIVKLNFA